MSSLRIRLLGGVEIAHGDTPAASDLTHTLQTLLAYLLLQRHRTHSRNVLMGVFWGDQPEEKARGCLNSALWRLRRLLEPAGMPRGTYLTTLSNGDVTFNRADAYWLDVAVLEERAAPVMNAALESVNAADVEALTQALPLYRGDLLEGVYSDWALRERERVRTIYLNALARLVDYYHGRGSHEQGITCAGRLLALDPPREDVHRKLMKLYLKTGQRELAARQFEICRDALRAELDVEPMEETLAVYAQASGGSPQRALGSRAPGVGNPRLLVQRLHRTLRLIDQARDEFANILHALDRTPPVARRR